MKNKEECSYWNEMWIVNLYYIGYQAKISPRAVRLTHLPPNLQYYFTFGFFQFYHNFLETQIILF